MEINAAKFRANCLKLLDKVYLTKDEIIIMKHGKPVAKLIGISKPDETDPLIGGLTNIGKTREDLTKPFDDDWELNA